MLVECFQMFPKVLKCSQICDLGPPKRAVGCIRSRSAPESSQIDNSEALTRAACDLAISDFQKGGWAYPAQDCSEIVPNRQFGGSYRACLRICDFGLPKGRLGASGLEVLPNRLESIIRRLLPGLPANLRFRLQIYQTDHRRVTNLSDRPPFGHKSIRPRG